MAGPQQTRNATRIPATYFAPPERTTREELQVAVEKIAHSPFLHTMLELLSGWIAVLNQNRQVLAINHAFLQSLGVDDPGRILGLRPGEAVNCVHAYDHPAGCGTGKFCATCGAAIAIVATQKTKQPQERECVLTLKQDGGMIDRILVVRCRPFEMEGEPLLLICMQDVSEERRRMALERTFLHDLSNILTALIGAAQVLRRSPAADRPELLAHISKSADMLAREVRFQRLLCQDKPENCRLVLEKTRPSELLEQIESLFANHPVAEGQTIVVNRPEKEYDFETDSSMLVRILANMVTNACEAGREGDTVRIDAESAPDGVSFRVWNRQPIASDTAMRVFQRYFSTKTGEGRGLGTFAMKLLGETLLKGQVSFTTSAAKGTTFRIHLPAHIGQPYKA